MNLELREIREGLYVFPLILPKHGFGDLNCYVIKGTNGGRNLLIDTGSFKRHYRVAFFDALQELAFTPDNTDILLTHAHGDHSGNIVEVSELGYRVLMTRETYEKENDSYKTDEARLRLEGMTEIPEGILYTGTTMGCDVSAAKVELIGYGDVLRYGNYAFEVIHTPGHSMGHISLYDRESRIMLMGDLTIYDMEPAICWCPYSEDALQDYFDSLALVESYDVSWGGPSHGTIDGDLYRRIGELRAYHEERLRTMENMVRETPGQNGIYYMNRMTLLRYGIPIAACSSGQSYMAVWEAVAWMDHLVHTDRVERKEKDGVYHYYPIV